MAETNQLAVVAKESGLEESKVKTLLNKFAEPFQQAQTIIDQAKEIKVTSEDQRNEMQEAREARIELKRIRVDVEHTRKQLKEQSLREGKAIDGMSNVFKALVVPVEEHLEKQEKFAERLAEERHARKVAERQNVLEKYTEDASLYNFENVSDEDFEALIEQLKNAKAAKEAAEKKLAEEEAKRQKQFEEERIAREKAAAEEAERIRKENEKLKAEAEAREAALEKERKTEAAKQAKLEAENAKKIAEANKAAEAERKRREAIEAAEKAKVEAEAKAKAEQEEAERKALLAPDKEKLIKFADRIDTIELPNVSNREAGKVLDETQDFLTRISKNLRQKAKEL